MPRLLRIIAAILAVGLSVPARSAIPANLSLGRVVPTPSGIVDTRYRDGNDGTTGTPLSWGTCPTITLTNGGACTTNLRTACTLVEAGSPTSTLSLFAGTLPSGCSISGDGITGTVGAVASGQIRVRATRGAATADTALFTVQSLAAGTDTAAPTIPLALAGVDNLDGTASLTWEAAGDPNVSGTVTGVTQYQVKLGGTGIATVTAPTANIQPVMAATLIGATDGESASQTGAQWTLTYAGTGLLATADGIYGRMAAVSGDYSATLKLTSYTPTSGTAGSVGIAARASNSAVGSIAVYSRWRDSDDKCNQRYRSTTDGSASNGTVSASTYTGPWIKQTRSGDVFATYCSSNSGQTWTLTSSQTVSAGATVYVGPFVTSGAAASTATAVVDDFAITQSGPVSYLYTGAGGTFAVNAYDGANRSSDSATVVVTPTGGAPATLVTVPAATHTVCNSGCTYTPSQLATVAISARAAGDSLELRADAAGATTEWAARILCNAKSGTSGSPIWIAVRDGDTIRLDTSTAANVGLLDMTDCDYWNIVGSRDGTTTGLVIADASQWHNPPAFHSNPRPVVYPNDKAVMIRSSTGVALVGMTVHGGRNTNSSLIDKNSTDVLLKYVEVSGQGTNTYDWGATGSVESAGAGSLSAFDDSDSGEIFHNCSTRSVYDGFYVTRSGHKQNHFCGPYHVVRRSKFNGNWADHSTYPQFTGNHSVTVQTMLNISSWNTATIFGPLIEDSLIYGVGSEPEHKLTNETWQMQALNGIFRGNYIVQRAGADGLWGRFGPSFINACASSGSIVKTDFSAYLHVYHNTVYGGAVATIPGNLPTGTYTAAACAEWKIKSNLFQGQQYNIASGSNAVNQYRNTVLATIPTVTTSTNDGYANVWKGHEWMGNVFGKHPSDPVGADFWKVSLSTKKTNVDSGAGTGSGTAALTDCVLWPSNWCNNTEFQVVWNSSGTTAAIANYVADAIPNPSTMRAVLTPNAASYTSMGTALHLTTVDAVTDGTNISLASARYFKDAWSISYTWGGLHTEYGDCIAIGADAATAVTARITAINYTNGNITFTPSRTITNGWKVWKATDVGDGTCGAIWDAPGAAQ